MKFLKVLCLIILILNPISSKRHAMVEKKENISYINTCKLITGKTDYVIIKFKN
jgi:hypothetical protein